MFDLNTLAIKDSAELHLKHPVTEELLYADAEKTQPVKAVLWSTSSKQYRAAINAIQNRAIKRQGKPASVEQGREDGINLLTSCTQRFENLTLNGKSVGSDADLIRELYSDDRFAWLKGQVDVTLGSVENFIEA